MSSTKATQTDAFWGRRHRVTQTPGHITYPELPTPKIDEITARRWCGVTTKARYRENQAHKGVQVRKWAVASKWTQTDEPTDDTWTESTTTKNATTETPVEWDIPRISPVPRMISPLPPTPPKREIDRKTVKKSERKTNKKTKQKAPKDLKTTLRNCTKGIRKTSKTDYKVMKGKTARQRITHELLGTDSDGD